MAFVTDSKSYRTFDPDSGWELKVKRGGMGAEDFALVHPSLGRIQFWGVIVATESLPEFAADGRPLCKTIYEMKVVDGRRADTASETTRSLIQQALQAYGRAFSGPLGPVEVNFGN